MIKELIFILIPAALSNMAPIFFKKSNFLKYPIDFRLNFRNKRILGENKTFRGLFYGLILSIFAVYVLIDTFTWDVNYSFGFWIGVGVLGGDLIGSFIKRRFDIKPGEPYIPLDQLDSVIGLVIVLLFYHYNFVLLLLLIVIWFVGHVLLRRIGFWLNIVKEKY